MDLNVAAFRIVQGLTTDKKEDKRVSAARAGGRIGGPARAAKLTTERRRAIALKANAARWTKRKEAVNEKEGKNNGNRNNSPAEDTKA